jgi:AraC-like DNA-binding protein
LDFCPVPSSAGDPFGFEWRAPGWQRESMQEGPFHAAYGFPNPGLAGVIQSYWEVKGLPGTRREKILPRGEVVLVVNLGDPQRLLGKQESDSQRFSDAWICGFQKGPLFVEATGFNWLCGARLRADGAFLLLGEAVSALGGEVVSLSDIFPVWGRSLVSRLRRAASASERFDIFDRALGEMLQPRTGREQSLAWIARKLSFGETDRISSLAVEIGWSRQRVHERFQQSFGLSPKAFDRLARFDRALQFVHRAEMPLAQIAQICGYFDQAHFSREFRAFADETPGTYRVSAVEVADHGFVNVPESED